MLVASQLGRRSVGIDLAEEYLQLARERAAAL
jgi:DNA modification methylase